MNSRSHDLRYTMESFTATPFSTKVASMPNNPLTYPPFTPAEIRQAKAFQQARQQQRLAAREALRSQALQAVMAKAPQIIARYKRVTAAYLFGSILRAGAFRLDSDIDIGVVDLPVADYTPLRTDLEAALPAWEIDLRELPPDTSFTALVKQGGQLIYDRDHPLTTG